MVFVACFLFNALLSHISVSLISLVSLLVSWRIDVYSYAEDDEVIDPHLERHLRHWGINIADMKKVT